MTNQNNKKLNGVLLPTYKFVALNESDLFREPPKGFLPSGYFFKRSVFKDPFRHLESLRKFAKNQSGVYIWLGFSKSNDFLLKTKQNKRPEKQGLPFRPYTYVGCAYTDLYRRISSYNSKAPSQTRPVNRFIKVNGLDKMICVVFTVQKIHESSKNQALEPLIASYSEYYFLQKLKPNLNVRLTYSLPPPRLRPFSA